MNCEVKEMALPKKMMVVNILEILKKYSDQNHRLTQKDIIGYLKKKYAMDVDRKAVRRNLTNLLEAGYPISYEETIRSGPDGLEELMLTDWYLERDFTEPELRLLIDGLLFSNHIPQHQCKDLIEKLMGLSSCYFDAKVSHVSNLPDNKPVDKELFFTIETLNDAISDKKKVAFLYVDYWPDKQQYERKNREGKIIRYIFNPYQMAASNGRYYLIGNHDAYHNVSNLRVDRIRKIEILDEPAKPMGQVEGLENGLDLPRHMAEHVYMFAGESVRVKFLAPQWMMNDLIDWFGMDVQVTVPHSSEDATSHEDGTEEEKCGGTPKDKMLTVTVRMNRQAMFYWAMQYGCHTEVLEPADLREQLRQTAGEMAERYGDRGKKGITCI